MNYFAIPKNGNKICQINLSYFVNTRRGSDRNGKKTPPARVAGASGRGEFYLNEEKMDIYFK